MRIYTAESQTQQDDNSRGPDWNLPQTDTLTGLQTHNSADSHSRLHPLTGTTAGTDTSIHHKHKINRGALRKRHGPSKSKRGGIFAPLCWEPEIYATKFFDSWYQPLLTMMVTLLNFSLRVVSQLHNSCDYTLFEKDNSHFHIDYMSNYHLELPRLQEASASV